MLAAELQAALLPRRCPAQCEHQMTAARNRMCGSVGGDFYDFIRINEDQVGIVIGDMVGHGVRASLLMANIMGWLRSEPANRSRPIQVVTELNRQLVDLGNRTGSIIPCSMFYMVIDQPTGNSFFINAGHPRPFLCDRNRCFTLALGAKNMLLGVEDFNPEEGCHLFEPGQRLVLYTDGITEALDAAGTSFGKNRLGHIINQSREKSPQDLADGVFTELDRFRNGARQTDDETVVVFDRI